MNSPKTNPDNDKCIMSIPLPVNNSTDNIPNDIWNELDKYIRSSQVTDKLFGKGNKFKYVPPVSKK